MVHLLIGPHQDGLDGHVQGHSYKVYLTVLTKLCGYHLR